MAYNYTHPIRFVAVKKEPLKNSALSVLLRLERWTVVLTNTTVERSIVVGGGFDYTKPYAEHPTDSNIRVPLRCVDVKAQLYSLGHELQDIYTWSGPDMSLRYEETIQLLDEFTATNTMAVKPTLEFKSKLAATPKGICIHTYHDRVCRNFKCTRRHISKADLDAEHQQWKQQWLTRMMKSKQP